MSLFIPNVGIVFGTIRRCLSQQILWYLCISLSVKLGIEYIVVKSGLSHLSQGRFSDLILIFLEYFNCLGCCLTSCFVIFLSLVCSEFLSWQQMCGWAARIWAIYQHQIITSQIINILQTSSLIRLSNLRRNLLFLEYTDYSFLTKPQKH